MPLQWRNQIWQSLKESAGKRCSECGAEQLECFLSGRFARVVGEAIVRLRSDYG